MSVESSVERIIAVLEERALGHDIDIVDVEVVGSAKTPVVRVRIDHANEDGKTISLDEVAAETGWISDALCVESVILSAFPAVKSLCRLRLWRGAAGILASF